MTEKKLEQTKAEQQQQTQAIELDDARLETAQGGVAIDGITRAGTKGIKDGTSN